MGQKGTLVVNPHTVFLAPSNINYVSLPHLTLLEPFLYGLVRFQMKSAFHSIFKKTTSV